MPEPVPNSQESAYARRWFIFSIVALGKTLGLQATVVGGAVSLGPTLGGFLIGLFGWRSTVLFYVPLGIIGAILSSWFD